ncbi:MAG: PD-(D/E)XK nuclease family protein [Nanoarchaeota archaeon]
MNTTTSIKKTFKLSPSTINLMIKCPRCFWLERHKVWKRPSGPFPQLPNGMDRVLKHHFDRFMKQNKLPPELCNNDHCEDMKLFDDEDLLKEWRNARKGLWFEDKEKNVLHGGIDNILKKGKKLIVLDYKTKGLPAKEDDQKYSQHQLDIYNFLLRKMGYETEDYAFLLFYSPLEVLETGEILFHNELRKIKTSVKDAEELFNKAIKLLNSDCPKKSCEWCEGR